MITGELFDHVDGVKINRYKLIETMVYRDPLYESWRRIGKTLVERQLSQGEILDLFKRIEQAQAETGTNRTNRTMLGKGKDWVTDIGNQVGAILGRIQDSAPIAAVDVAYDQATDAVANMMGGRDGDKSKIMDAIKKYRLLVKAYPKTAGFAKAALVAIAGFATGGAGLPAIAGLTYALDSAIRGDKLSSVLGKGAGAAALSWAGQKVAGMVGSDPTAAGDGTTPDHSGAAVDPGMTPDHAGVATPGGGTYTIQKGDQLGYIAQANGNTVKQLMAANPQIDFSKALQPGQQLNLPPSGPVGVGSVWKDYPGGVYGDKLRESFMVNVLPLGDMINRRRTIYRWALNENKDNTQVRSVVLTNQGVNHIIEETTNLHNSLVEYIRKKNVYRPDMPKAPTDDDDATSAATKPKRKKSGGKVPGELSTTSSAIKKREKRRQDREAGITPKPAPSPAPSPTEPRKPGLIGRGLNWLDRATQTFGRQLTNKVTAEKLKMNWHQFGKPFDSDQLAQWLIDNQKISPEVVSQVYAQLKLPLSTPSTSPTTTPTPTDTNKASVLVPSWDREKGRFYTRTELDKKYSGSTTPTTTTAPTTPTTPTPMAAPEPADSSTDTTATPAGAGTGAMASMVSTLTQPTAPTPTPVGTTAASSTGGTTTELPTGRVHRAKTTTTPTATASTTIPTATKPNYAQQPQGYGPITLKTPGISTQPTPTAVEKPAPAKKKTAKWTGRKKSTAKPKSAKVGATAPVPKQKWTGRKPTRKQSADYFRALNPPQTAESLVWSKNWDPSRLLLD